MRRLSKKAFEAWQKERESRPRGIDSFVKTGFNGVVLGVDPSLRSTGLAAIQFDKGRVQLLHSQAITSTSKTPITEVLKLVFEQINHLLQFFAIEHIATEQMIYAKNAQIARTLAHVQGVVMLAGTLKGIPAYSYPPARVKQAVLGRGQASKEQVARMVSHLLSCPSFETSDEADAAAVALCHGWTCKGIAGQVPV